MSIIYRYRIIYAVILMTIFGPSVLLTLRVNGFITLKMCLQTRYSTIWTDKDVDSINNGTQRYYLLKRGRKKSCGFILALEI
jgi:hypothetical protein